MGLLDDAIREHLELKRRRGADPAEVEKQEREALGPVGAPGVEERPAPVDDAPPIAEDTDDRVTYDDDPDPFADAHAPLREEPPPPPRSEGAVRAPEPPPEPAPAREEPPPPPPPVDQPTEQYSVEDVDELRRREDAAVQEPEEGEDVLDETPDFLQEAPEHDRLWFEQRPPRDFDF